MINLLKASAQRLLKKQAFHFSTNEQLLYGRAFLSSEIINEIKSHSSSEINTKIQTQSLRDKIMSIIEDANVDLTAKA
jgi:hypothetical protein